MLAVRGAMFNQPVPASLRQRAEQIETAAAFNAEVGRCRDGGSYKGGGGQDGA
jgi:hypothetical protein